MTMAIRVALLALLAASLAVAPPAAAKEIRTARVCGSASCFTFDRANSGGKLMLFGQAGGQAAPPSRSAPWYRLRISVGGRDVEPSAFTNAYVPSLDLLRVCGEGGGYAWVRVIADLRPVLRTVAGRLEPLPASSLAGVQRRGHARAAAAAGADPGGTRWWLIVPAAGGAAALVVLTRRLRRRT
jgi:hypothetical protein